jgi:tetratricopeptide (TPR) repeat protein
MAHYNLGVVLQATGDLDGAIEHYQAGLSTQRDYALLHFALGGALAKKGETRQAARAFETFLGLEQDTPANRELIDQAQRYIKKSVDEPADKVAEVATEDDPTGGEEELDYLNEDHEE